MKKLEILKEKVLKSKKFTQSSDLHAKVYYFDDFLIVRTTNKVPCYVKDCKTGVILYNFEKREDLDNIIKLRDEKVINSFFEVE